MALDIVSVVFSGGTSVVAKAGWLNGLSFERNSSQEYGEIGVLARSVEPWPLSGRREGSSEGFPKSRSEEGEIGRQVPHDKSCVGFSQGHSGTLECCLSLLIL